MSSSVTVSITRDGESLPPRHVRTYTITGTRLDEFERDCASAGCTPEETINILINMWLSNGRDYA
jgi:hypothetical protein